MVQIKSIVVGSLLLVQLVTASKYASSGANEGAIYLSSTGGSSGVSDGSAGDLSNQLLNSLPEFVSSGPSYQSAGGANVPAAIQTKRTVEVKPVNIPQEPVEPHIVDVEATYQPVHVVFRSSSSPVMVQQIHTPAQPAQVEATTSEDQPHRVQHSVIRPVIQEVHEVITPYRRVLQEIRPVQEEVRTIVAKAEATGRAARPSGDGLALANGGNGAGLGNGASGSVTGLGGLGAGAGSYASAYASAAASVPAPSYTRGRRSSAVRATQRKSYSRRVALAAAKRQQHQQLYTA